ncbi:MAG TPA: methylenetetrahydrofolate reductase [Acidimicrobiales bacterium]|nr:methylenetetrahydrofolate reductase [Acidimicrobiales bacterium]
MARVADLLAAGRTVSFEFFPPKTDAAQAQLVRALRELEPLDPSFVSVTYGAGGSTRERTHDLVVGMLKTTALTPMAHLTCAAHSRLDLAEILVRYRRAGLENLLALGGDPSKDPDSAPTELATAEALVDLAQAVGGFSIGVAAHPELHPRSPDRASDRRHLAAKLAKADFAITQLFFRADDYLRLRDDLHHLGCTKPVVAGIMPILSLKAVTRMAQLSGAAVPPEVVARIEAAGDDPEDVRRAGVEVATELCQTLLAEGVPGLHFYTLNQSTATREIAANLDLRPVTA